MTILLAADIGGTKSDLAIFDVRPGAPLLPQVQKRYRNAQFAGVAEIITLFLEKCPNRPRRACIAVAGVVGGERVHLTNLPWVIDRRSLEKQFGFHQVTLINDLTAVAAATLLLGPDDLAEIQAGEVRGGEIRGIIAPGTGLGEGLLVEIDGRLFARGSEGGHCDFAPVDSEQLALLAWMREKTRPVSYEKLIAGPGFAHLYDFAKEFYGLPETAAIALAMAGTEDRTPIIVKGAVDSDGCPVCRRAMELFLSILGSEAGNLALKLYARGGIYLGGGILPRLLGKISFAGFLRSFRSKGAMAELMGTIPVQLITRADAALLGAAHYGGTVLFNNPPPQAGDER
jgi:glucokinase